MSAPKTRYIKGLNAFWIYKTPFFRHFAGAKKTAY